MDRRHFLQGLGATALALPVFSSLPRRAKAQAIPHRVLLMYNSNGTINDAFNPTVTQNGLSLGPILAPLEAHKDDLIVVRGLRNEAAINSPEGGGGHATGTGCLWNGVRLSDVSVDGPNGPANLGGGITIDRYLGRELGAGTKFDSLELGVQVNNQNLTQTALHMSYDGDAQPVTVEDNPASLFQRLFGDFTVDDSELQRIRAERSSVLDAVAGQIEALSPRLGNDDKLKLDAHLTAIREIETRLTSDIVLGGSCELPAEPSIADHNNPLSFPDVGKAQADMLAMALACDMTRVGSVMWSTAGSRTKHEWLGLSTPHHGYSHNDVLYRDELIQIGAFYAEQMAYLIDALKSKTESDGSTLFDHTTIVWGNPLQNGNHNRDDLPFVIAGGGIATQAGGRFEDYGSRPHNDLLVTLLQIMGLDDQSFGQYGSGPLGITQA